MKKIIIIVLCIVGVVAIAYPLMRMYTKMASPEATAAVNTKDLIATVYYCQPSKKGRVIFGSEEEKAVVVYGQLWRTGANEATEIELSRDVTINGKSLKAGRYALFTIPEKDKWTIVFNTVLGMWGHFTYDQTKDALRTEVTPTEIDSSLELFTIGIKEAKTGADLTLAWDKTQVVVPIR